MSESKQRQKGFEELLEKNKDAIRKSSEVAQEAFKGYVELIRECHEKDLITKVGEMKFVAINTSSMILLHMINSLSSAYGDEAGEAFAKDCIQHLKRIVETDKNPDPAYVKSYEKIIGVGQ